MYCHTNLISQIKNVIVLKNSRNKKIIKCLLIVLFFFASCTEVDAPENNPSDSSTAQYDEEHWVWK